VCLVLTETKSLQLDSQIDNYISKNLLDVECILDPALRSKLDLIDKIMVSNIVPEV
jgi:hypothetical protein